MNTINLIMIWVQMLINTKYQTSASISSLFLKISLLFACFFYPDNIIPSSFAMDSPFPFPPLQAAIWPKRIVCFRCLCAFSKFFFLIWCVCMCVMSNTSEQQWHDIIISKTHIKTHPFELMSSFQLVYLVEVNWYSKKYVYK